MLSRASWAAGAIDEQGGIIGVAHGPVWRNLPQTSPTAEVVGMAAIAQLIPPNTTALTTHIDNSMVVRALNDPLPFSDLHRAFHAGVLRTARAQKGWVAMQGRACHIKSHVSDDRPEDLAKLPLDEQHKYKGNMMADTQADKANHEWHEPLVKDLVAIDHMGFKAARAVCRLAAAILPQYPPLRTQGFNRRRRQPTHTATTTGQDADAQDDLAMKPVDDYSSVPTSIQVSDHRQTAARNEVAKAAARQLAKTGKHALTHGYSTPSVSSVPPPDDDFALYSVRCVSHASAASVLARPSFSASEGSDGSTREVVANFPHAWRPAGIATWRCTQCGSMATACPAQPEGGACTGLPKAMVAKKGKGHVLWRFEPTPNSPFAAYICCQECGGIGLPAGLAEPVRYLYRQVDVSHYEVCLAASSGRQAPTHTT